ncbi:hypothetical protein ACQKMI_19295 [Lysinibacillus sp. NPDC097214]|uniref:hypothetical protein n=1 Tax=Lysinibacillus sp. NPDC097214 TaxID=3390584 RepID=UPI003D03C2B2
MYNEVSKKYNEVSTNLFEDHQRLVGEWTRNSRYLERREKMKVTAKEWRVMSDHNKQLLLNAVATK